MSISNFLLRFFVYQPLPVGQPAPSLSLTAHDGTWVRSEDLQDNTCYLLFFFPSFTEKESDVFLQNIESLHQDITNFQSSTREKYKGNSKFPSKVPPIKIFAVTDKNITILRKEVDERQLSYPLLYDPFAIESRRFGLSRRRPMCSFGYVMVDKNGICIAYQRGIPDFDEIASLVSNQYTYPTDSTTPKTTTISNDELSVGYVDTQEAEAKLLINYRIIDVRTLPEYEADHIPNAIHVPLDDLHNRHQELDPLKELLFVCQTGTRATAAAEFLTSIGGQHIFVIQGGMSEWNGERRTGGKI